jgi:hypothetical protein
VVDDAPEVFGCVVRSDRLACERGVRHVNGRSKGMRQADEEGAI